jgi:6-phosphogluconate dehydrogenase
VEIGLIGLGKIDMIVVRRLEQLKGSVQDSGESRWIIPNATEKEVPVPTLRTAFFTRVRSRQIESFPEKMLAALRNGFGDHSVHR